MRPDSAVGKLGLKPTSHSMLVKHRESGQRTEASAIKPIVKVQVTIDDFSQFFVLWVDLGFID